MDGSIINVALPTLQVNFRASSSEIIWVVQGYALLSSALLLFCGALGDLWGRKRIYLSGVAVFALASIGCAASLTLTELITARAIQGLGAALLIPQGLAILSDTYPEDERPGAIGIWSAWTSVSIALGPILGGWLIQVSGWRTIFLLNLPLTVWIFWLAPKMKGGRGDDAEVVSYRLDYLGAILNTLGFGAIVFALSFVPQFGWKDVRIDLSFAAGILLLLAFVWSQRVNANALVPLSLFRSSAFSRANLLTFLAYGALGGAFYVVPFFLIGVRQFSPSAAGAAFLPMIAFMFVFSGPVGKLAVRVGEVRLMAVGSALTAVGFALLGILSGQTGYVVGFLPGVLALGVGITLTVAPLTSFIMSSVVESRRGTASAVNNSVSRLAALISVSIVTVAMSHIFNAELRKDLDSSGLPLQMQRQLIASKGLMLAIPIPETFGAREKGRAEELVEASFVAGYRNVVFGCALITLFGTVVIMTAGGKSGDATRRASELDGQSGRAS
jgi:EmrB/QacA subfamily drug resistance transporter